MIDFTKIVKQIDPVISLKREYSIGIIGSGGIVDTCHLVAYKEMGFKVLAIMSADKKQAEEVAARHGIPEVMDTYEQLCSDERIDVVDIAVPPQFQLEIASCAVKNGKHILCQKPLTLGFGEAETLVKLAEDAGVKMCVNQNCRWAPSSRVIKALLDGGHIGKPVLANIELRFPIPWQSYCPEYERLMLNHLSIHHIDVFRYWFGDPKAVTALTAKYPDQQYNGDTIALYNLQYSDGLIASSLDDGFTWSGLDDSGCRIRIEGTKGIVKATFGWAHDVPDSVEFLSREDLSHWYKPEITRKWYPDAFRGTMCDLLTAIDNDAQPVLNGRDNLKTMRIIEAAYKSAAEGRSVEL